MVSQSRRADRSVTRRHGVPSLTALSMEACVGSTTSRRNGQADGGRITGTATTGKSKVARTRPIEAGTSDCDRAETRPWTRRMTDGSGSAPERERRASRTLRSTNSVFPGRFTLAWLLYRRYSLPSLRATHSTPAACREVPFDDRSTRRPPQTMWSSCEIVRLLVPVAYGHPVAAASPAASRLTASTGPGSCRRRGRHWAGRSGTSVRL